MRGHHGYHGSDIDAIVLAAVARVDAADDFCSDSGFAAAGDAGNADQDAVGGEGIGEECY